MKKILFSCAFVLILVMSLVPLSGVSAQRTAPASSADPAPAAQATYTKTIKTQVVKYCGGAKCYKYVQKMNWTYDNSAIVDFVTTVNGVSFNANWFYIDFKFVSGVGAIGMPYASVWTEGMFLKPSVGKLVFINIWQTVLADGTWVDRTFSYKQIMVEA